MFSIQRQNELSILYIGVGSVPCAIESMGDHIIVIPSGPLAWVLCLGVN